MIRALQSGLNPTRSVNPSLTLPAPIGGWNNQLPLAAMPPQYAVQLDNFICEPTGLVNREGAANWVTNFALPVRTLIPYSGATSKLFAATNGGIYDVTASGAVGAVVSSCTNGSWQTEGFGNGASRYVLMCNGVDAYKAYDGTTWTTPAITDPGTTGVSATNIFSLRNYKERLFFCRNASLNMYYLPAGTFSGALVEYPLGRYFRRGGRLVQLVTWTIDSGFGPDDYLVTLSSEGEVAVFTGTDPSSATTWKLQGIYFIGRPLGQRGAIKWKGDVLMLTEYGVYPLSQALLSTTVDRQVSLSLNIDNQINKDSVAYFNNFGWQLEFNPTDATLLVNIPAVPSVQYAFQTQTKGWSRFTGLDASCMLFFNGRIYLGMSNKVAVLNGPQDFGTNISLFASQAYNYFGSRRSRKRITLARHLFQATGPFTYQNTFIPDFSSNYSLSLVSAMAQGGSNWGTGLWGTAVWGGTVSTVASWRHANNKPAYAFSNTIVAAVNGVDLRWISTEIQYEVGGLL